MLRAFDLRPILFANGALLFILAAAMAAPAAADALAGHPNWRAFALSSTITLFIAVSLAIVAREERSVLSARQGFCMAATAWASVALFGALPLLFSDIEISFVDAVFESTSGITTTGATVLVGIDGMSPGVLLWRGMLQWLGGVGLIVMAALLLPELRVGGMQIFRPDGPSGEGTTQRVVALAARLWGVYAAVTALGFAALLALGLEPAAAAVHAMTSVATGGFSTCDASVACFDSAAVEAALLALMVAGSLPFLQMLRAASGRPGALLRDAQARWLLAALALSSLAVAFWLVMRGYPPLYALRASAFNTVSAATGTGYSTAAYDQWGAFPLVLLAALMMIGGCAGSSCSGIKVFRARILISAAAVHLNRLAHPRSVYVVRMAGAQVSDAVVQSTMIFVFVFLASIAAVALALAALGLDSTSAISGAVATIANVGPALGPEIGPSGNYAGLGAGAKAILCFAMLLGRIELYALLALLTPGFWRDLSARRPRARAAGCPRPPSDAARRRRRGPRAAPPLPPRPRASARRPAPPRRACARPRAAPPGRPPP